MNVRSKTKIVPINKAYSLENIKMSNVKRVMYGIDYFTYLELNRR